MQSVTETATTTVHVPPGLRYAVAAESSRYATHAVEIRPSAESERVYLSATDGRCAVVVMAEGTCAAPDLIPADALPSRKAGDTLMRVNGHWRQLAGKKIVDALTPDTCPAFPPLKAVCEPADLYAGATVVCLSAELLAKVAESVKSAEGFVVLLIPKVPRKPIAVVGLGTSNFGLLMPAENKSPLDPIEEYGLLRDAYVAAH
jgi:hypothetical protein